MLSHEKFTKHFKVSKKSPHYFFTVNDSVLSGKNTFIAIVGERYNPLKNLDKLVGSSIKYIICEKKYFSKELEKYSFEFILVNNIEKSIAILGELIAEDFQARENSLIAISGSNGKTTTKEMLNHILISKLGSEKIIATQKNNNNHLGVPFTLFQINADTEFGIIELGSNAPGEIAFLANMIKPHYSVTTNIGETHLEFFGTKEAVYQEEASVADYTQKVFLKNTDDKFLNQLSSHISKTFGTSQADYTFEIMQNECRVNATPIQNKFILGDHNFFNLACALVMASQVLDCTLKELAEAAASFKPTKNRSQWVEWNKKQVFLDAYNSNPSSLRAALDAFEQYIKNNSNISMADCAVIIGDMNELGDQSESLHTKMGEFVRSKSFGKMIFIGRFADSLANNVTHNTEVFPKVETNEAQLKSVLSPYKYLFIKGSRSLQLERITDIK